MNGRNLKGALIASAVCAMFATAAHAQQDKSTGHAKAGGEVKCAGINSFSVLVAVQPWPLQPFWPPQPWPPPAHAPVPLQELMPAHFTSPPALA